MPHPQFWGSIPLDGPSGGTPRSIYFSVPPYVNFIHKSETGLFHENTDAEQQGYLALKMMLEFHS